MEVQKEAFSGLMEYYKLLPIKNKRDDLKQEEFLHAIFAYLNTLQDISAQFIDKMSEVINDKM